MMGFVPEPIALALARDPAAPWSARSVGQGSRGGGTRRRRPSRLYYPGMRKRSRTQEERTGMM